jgi:hypothetical protein
MPGLPDDRGDLPEGFEIDDDLPEGFEVDQPASSFGEYLRAIPRAIAQGVTALPRMMAGQVDPESVSAIGPQSIPLEQQKETLQTAQDINRRTQQGFERGLERVGLPAPTHTGPKFVEGALSQVADPTSYLGAGGLIRKGITAAASGLGSETAGEAGEALTGSPGVGTAGRILGGVLGGSAAGAAMRPGPVARPPRWPITSKREQYIADLRARGTEPTAGDITGSKAVRHWEEAGDYFFGGQSYTRNREKIAESSSWALAQEMGVTPLEFDFHGRTITPEMVKDARESIGNDFDQSALNLEVRLDKKMKQDFIDMLAQLRSEHLEPPVMDRILFIASDVYNKFELARNLKNPILTGRAFQSAIAKGAPLDRAINDANPNISFYATKMRDLLDQGAIRTNSSSNSRKQFLDIFERARSRWFHMLVAQDAITRAGEFAQAGLISPQRLRAELTKGDDRRTMYALERSRLAAYARAGNVIMPQPKTSGTAERLTHQSWRSVLWGIWGRMVNSGFGQRTIKGMTRPSYYDPAGRRALLPSVLSAGGDQDDDALAAPP